MERISALSPEEEAIILLDNRLAIIDALHCIIRETPPAQEIDPGIQQALTTANKWRLPGFRIPDSNV